MNGEPMVATCAGCELLCGVGIVVAAYSCGATECTACTEVPGADQ